MAVQLGHSRVLTRPPQDPQQSLSHAVGFSEPYTPALDSMMVIAITGAEICCNNCPHLAVGGMESK